MREADLTGDRLAQIMGTLANPHRLRVLAALTDGRNYVSGLARQLGISRPLLQVHLRRLEESSLVAGALELSPDGKAMKYYEVIPFSIHLTPETIAAATRSLTTDRTTGGHDRPDPTDHERR
jgi:predicted transcriptional regulator